MENQNSILKFIPKVSKRTLLLEATCVWLIAGSVLFIRGIISIKALGDINYLILIACIIGGIGFFRVMFLKISDKYIKHIKDRKEKKSHIFSFFSPKGYLMMILMISFGITLKKLNVIPLLYLSYFFFFMATPLLLSAVRFLIAAIKHKEE